ncbi:MAG: hypothetical protein JWO50_754 [Candidatus Kaiserbacteria bacterium]|nr:hypothetical protein [Candidatus Kaiserbacteria bacterium]
MLTIIAIGVCVATLIGGIFALHLNDKLHLILGFSAGAVIGVAFFDLLPESLDLASQTYGAHMLLTVTALGFALYLILDRYVLLHNHDTNAHNEHGEHDAHIERGMFGALSLSAHSFLDGIAIGLSFQVSTAVGAVVALAVLAHDFSDGINTVSMILKNEGGRRTATKWLLTDALAPVAGIIATNFFVVSEPQLGLLLALFAGFFFYIGASDLIPESYHAHPMRWTTLSTVLGMVSLYAVIRLAGV